MLTLRTEDIDDLLEATEKLAQDGTAIILKEIEIDKLLENTRHW
ncbi:hypothetical protein [Mesobacillus zeae]|nr:hypothetical protein [Mesobacillus zeae]